MTILMDIFKYLMFGLPILALIAFFIVSLVLFVKAPKNSPQRKTRKVLLIVSFVILGVFVLTIIGFAVIFSMAIMYM